MIHFANVTKRYEATSEALSNLSFEIEKQQLVCLTGHSGAGKSTLLKLLLMMEQPTAGQIIIDGLNLSRLKKQQIPLYRRQIGMVFQNPKLIIDRNIFENVSLPLRVCGIHPQEIKRRVRSALDRVKLLHTEKMMPMQLSGGEQQRIGIARAVVNQPKLLLADEPTGNLDPTLSQEIFENFLYYRQLGMTVLIATHDTALIEKFQVPRLVLDQGQLIESTLAEYVRA